MIRRLLLATFATLAAAEAAAQISPGELSRFHQSLEGARQCRLCHEAGKGVTPSLCLTCHTALAQRLAAGQGLHARPEYRPCQRCHVEHQGRDFDLVFWGRTGRGAFDHAQTGFVLRGRHAALTCESCHNANRVTDRAALAQGGAHLGRTFLGLSPACASCHADPHRGQFAPRACADCHAVDAAWQPAVRFDHARAAFPLAGAHARVTCARCHAPRADGTVVFRGTTQSCAACHRDPHGGRLGAQCASCHTTEGWSRIEPGRFDHGRTRFPLTGKHQTVDCARCHPAQAGGKLRFQGTPFQTCASCHRDPHGGRLGPQCATCHTSASWRQGAAARVDHDRTRFPLRGKHAEVGCESCHREGRLTLAHAQCTDCHRDRHAGQLARRQDGGRCESCHDVGGWRAVRFTVDDHAGTAYPLTGAHLAVPCDSCHREVPLDRIRALGFGQGSGAPARTAQLRFSSTRCADCHADPHGARFARDGGTDCARCHATSGWTSVRFDHDRETAFPLLGAHRTVACAGCHRRHTAQGVVVRYSGLGTACTDCHGAQGGAPRRERP